MIDTYSDLFPVSHRARVLKYLYQPTRGGSASCTCVRERPVKVFLASGGMISFCNIPVQQILSPLIVKNHFRRFQSINFKTKVNECGKVATTHCYKNNALLQNNVPDTKRTEESKCVSFWIDWSYVALIGLRFVKKKNTVYLRSCMPLYLPYVRRGFAVAKLCVSEDVTARPQQPGRLRQSVFTTEKKAFSPATPESSNCI